MKIKLLAFLLLLTTITFSQVNSFYGTNNSIFSTLTSVTPLTHGAGGTNQTWNFGSLLSVGTSVYTYVAPTVSETTTYPGTTNVIVTNTTEGTTTTTGRMFTKNTAGNTLSITGLNGTDLNINFSTNNATLGVFPMAYGYTNTDSNVAGTYDYTTYSGTFTGTLVTTVDATGTLNLIDFGYSANVTRLKTVLTLSLNSFPFSNVGTVTQTSYSYYDPTDTLNNPAFRSVNMVIVVPLLSINQDNTSLEKFNTILAAPSSELQTVWIQNPIQNTIEINTSNTIDNANISVTDMLGKTIYQAKNETINGTFEIPVSLTKGIYLINIGNENGSITKKIVKS
ncbi:MAG: T9SS type A sorting domain-containing protein [Flavobacterium sp.]|uniref:T9SS type A sorting domain-containing protein n=1 Tax=Flavobacterium sp. TaxID=239 RepID=UPI0032659E11